MEELAAKLKKGNRERRCRGFNSRIFSENQKEHKTI